MIKPDYKRGNIVNLMSSLGNAFGYSNRYNELKKLRSKEIEEYRNVILIVIDGLGYNYLMTKGRNSFMRKGLSGQLTTVFPATTSAAIPVFLFGVPPQQHALTGWDMYFKELKNMLSFLPFRTTLEGRNMRNLGIKVDRLIGDKPFSSKINVKSFYINWNKVKKTPFNEYVQKDSTNLFYNNLNGMFSKIRRAVSMNGSRKYVYTYWYGFDYFSHRFGNKSKLTQRNFNNVDDKIREFVNYLKKNKKFGKSIVIITSDHGFIDTPKKEIIWLLDYPEICECLWLPLLGDSRTCYCYVIKGMEKRFEKLVKSELSKFCHIYKSKDLIKKGFFGLGKADKRLLERIGDYTLIAKNNHTFTSEIREKGKKYHLSSHSGTSADEMFVPLIVFTT